jgi:hypothetical protein
MQNGRGGACSAGELIGKVKMPAPGGIRFR